MNAMLNESNDTEASEAKPHRATYSPEDNKLRIYPAYRLSREEFERIKAAGFKWAPKQELFVAPAWSPDREDAALDLCDAIEDEDTSLVDRASVRADRFEDYGDKRRADYERAQKAVEAIADNIPLGQPILIGHHSEKHARRDAERIENGMRRAVKMWDTANYWQQRAAGALANAKYKERPDVRARRIKTIEAEQRRQQRSVDESTRKLALWESVRNIEQARVIANVANPQVCRADGSGWTAYDVLQPDGERYSRCPSGWTWEQVRDVARRVYPRDVAYRERWLAHLANRLAYERAMLGETGYKAEPAKRATKAVLPLLNYAGKVSIQNPYHRGETSTHEAVGITRAQLADIPSEYKGTRVSADGTHRVRIAMAAYLMRAGALTNSADMNTRHSYPVVYLTDAKQHTPPSASAPADDETAVRIARAQDQVQRKNAAAARDREHNRAVIDATREPRTEPVREEKPAELEAMRKAAQDGVHIAVAPTLFPTPADVAAHVVELACIEPGMTVLEPSAGTGALVAAVIDAVDTEVVGYEINADLCALLSSKFPCYKLQARRADFLEVTEGMGQFPRVVMNPPFDNGADIRHVQHAFNMLAPGGRLVAIVANGPRQNAQLRPLASTWEELPAGTFAGTNVRAAIMVWDRATQ